MGGERICKALAMSASLTLFARLHKTFIYRVEGLIEISVIAFWVVGNGMAAMTGFYAMP